MLGISTEWGSQQKKHRNLLLLLSQEQALVWHPPATHSQMPKMLQKLMCSLGQIYPRLLQASEAACEDTRGIPWPIFTNEKAFNKNKCLLILLLLQRSAELWKKHITSERSTNTSLFKPEYKQTKIRLGNNKDWKQRLYVWVDYQKSGRRRHTNIILVAAINKLTLSSHFTFWELCFGFWNMKKYTTWFIYITKKDTLFHWNPSKSAYITLFAPSFSVAVLFTPGLTCSGLKSFWSNKTHRA